MSSGSWCWGSECTCS